MLFSKPKLDVLVNPTRTEQCVNAMAQCMAQVLVLKDPELSRPVAWKESTCYKLNKSQLSKARSEYWRREELNRARCVPFGALLHSEFAVKATKEQEERLGIIFKLDRFSRATTAMCSSMVEESDQDYEGDFFERQDEVAKAFDAETINTFQTEEHRHNVDLFYYAYSLDKSPFFVRYDYTTSNGFTIPVGGVSKSLCEEFDRLLNEWLHKCDKIFCKVHDIPCTEDASVDEHFRNVSKAIARRHSLMLHPQDKIQPRSVDSALDLNNLEDMSIMQYWNNNFTDYNERKLDLESLQALLTIAKHGGRAHESQNVILKETAALHRALEYPAQELGLHLEKRVKKFNFAALRKILSVGMDNPFMFCCECAQTWHENHGEWAAVEIQNAIDCINRPDFHAGTHYLDVAETQFKRGSIRLPVNPCAFETMDWYAYPPDFRKRTHLSNLGLRLVCMNTFLRKRLEAGTLKFGTCNKQILHNIATDHMRKSSYAIFMLEADRMRNNQGVSLLLFERDLQNAASDLNEMLDIPMCSLSGVSYSEIDCLFGKSDNFDAVRRELSHETRKLVPKGLIPEEYIRFTDDALTMVLGCIKSRRESHGIQSFVRTNAVADMLRCVPKIRNELSVARSFLSLSIQDLANSHPRLREWLENQSQHRNSFVWVESKGHSKTYFVFDVAHLRSLLKM